MLLDASEIRRRLFGARAHLARALLIVAAAWPDGGSAQESDSFTPISEYVSTWEESPPSEREVLYMVRRCDALFFTLGQVTTQRPKVQEHYQQLSVQSGTLVVLMDEQLGATRDEARQNLIESRAEFSTILTNHLLRNRKSDKEFGWEEDPVLGNDEDVCTAMLSGLLGEGWPSTPGMPLPY